ncbi:MAG: hypothetical protein PUE85_09085 [Firmicutes bacterium]|nr:hypothetical protein [Bacillota bacterium]
MNAGSGGQRPGIVVIDVHNMNCYQARALIDSRLKSAGGSVYRIRIVHGYNSGTALRDMIYETYSGRVKRIERRSNPGETDLVLRELI